MKQFLFSITAFFMTFSSTESILAQARSDSPEVLPDGRVTLRLNAPNAQVVKVEGIDGAPEMTRGGNGVWSVTLGPLAPEIYSYTFNVDGTTGIDPHNRNVKNWFSLERNRAFVAWLEERKIPHTFKLSEGGHEWPVWRRYLAEFLPLLFK